VTARRARIPPRRRFFLGCEGESEQSYGALLQIVADESLQLRIHLDLQLLGGGDPLAIVEAAVEEARNARGIAEDSSAGRCYWTATDMGIRLSETTKLLRSLRPMACCSFGSARLTKPCCYAIYLGAKP
jgi:hypothetical protein